ncbi:hypothetical protein J7438_23400 [Thalassotalea sp. G20_0]|uniref:hypothetical protein n=1 Tax=Thalassotalea sp. G20_0 TaxID=2821093 RepID=UPI001ADC9A90|nr:hypothetical protein [Thalassotalea sp. G20_0]MBO9497012.1 hypothetical protein [Thalassotalea sp. G20_0]
MNQGTPLSFPPGSSNAPQYGWDHNLRDVTIYDPDRQQDLSGKVLRTTSGAEFRCKPQDVKKIEKNLSCSHCSMHKSHIVEGRPLHHRKISNRAIIDVRPKDSSMIEPLKGHTLVADLKCIQNADPIHIQNFEEVIDLTAFSRRTIVYCAKHVNGRECLQPIELSDLPDHFHGDKHRGFPAPVIEPQRPDPASEDLMAFENLSETGSGDEKSMVQTLLMSGMEELERLQGRNDEQANEISQLNKTVEQLQNTVENLSLTCAEYEIQIKELKELQEQHTDGTFLWRIDNFIEAIAKAREGINTSFDSPVFYSAPEGYRMKATLFPYGDGNGEGTHISLFISIMKGMYDEILTWPFDQTLSFEIVGEGKEVLGVYKSEPDPMLPSFQKPESMNRGVGCDKFMAINDLTHILPGGSLFIRINLGEKARGY